MTDRAPSTGTPSTGMPPTAWPISRPPNLPPNLRPNLPPAGAARPRRGLWLTVLGALAVLLVLLVQRPGTPPLYDGVGFPDEPYRWVERPAGEPATADPTIAKAQLRVEGDRTSSAMVSSAEQGPQVALFVNVDTLKPPAGATAVNVEVAPAALPGPPPPNATPVSNLYRFRATPEGTDQPVGVVSGNPALINLRANEAVEAWVILHQWQDGAWKQLPTFQVGTDVYAASLFDFGDYALFRMDSADDVKVDATKPRPVPEGYTIGTAPQPGASPGASPGGPGAEAGQPLLIDTDPGVSNNRLWIGLGLAALILGGGLLLARRAARGQSQDDAQDRHDGDASPPETGEEPSS